MPDNINPFDTAAAQVVGDQTATIRQNITQNVGQNADTAAQYQHLAKFVGVPVDTVYAEPETIKQQAAVQKLDAPKMVNTYPHLAQFISNPDNAAKAHDDIPPLAATEQAVKSLPMPNAASAPPETSGWLSKNMAALPETPMAFLQGFAGSFNDAMKALNLIAGGVPTLYDQAASAITGRSHTEASDWWFHHSIDPLVDNEPAFQLRDNATTVEKTLHGVGGLIGTISQIISTGGSGEVKAGMEAVPALADTLRTGVETATKMMALPAVTSAVNAGQQVYAETGDANAAMRSAMATYATTTATGILPVSLEGNLLTRVASGIPAGALTGELSREATNAANPDSMQTPFNIDDLLVNAITGSILAGTMGHAGRPQYERVMREQYQDGKQAIDAVQAGEGLQALSEVATQTKLRERDPQAFSDYVRSMTADGHTPELYINAELLNETFKQSGVTSEKLAEQLPDVARQIQEAMATGADVKISTADYATHIAGGPVDEILRQHLKIDPNGKTIAEGQAYLDGLQQHTDEITSALAETQPAEDARRQQLATIHDEHLAELETAGRFPSDVNKQYAKARTALIDRLAEREGLDVTDVHNMLPLKVTADVQPRNKDFLDQKSLADWDAFLHGLDYSEKEAPTPGKNDESEFLSNSEAGTRHTDESPLLKRIRKSSDAAANELGGSAEAGRVVKKSLGPFTGYRTSADIIEGDSVHPDGRLEIHVYGKEQDTKGGDFTSEPALTFTVSKDGELTVNGPASNSPAFKAFQAEGWADTAKGKDGELQDGWAALKNKDGKPLNLTELAPLLADVHARVRTWRGEDKVGLRWSRSTGATGDISEGRKTAVFFQNGDPKDLYVFHNLSESNLQHADELGGLAAPSLGVGRADVTTPSNFGEVTLIGHPSLLEDPAGRTFDADVYTPRHPKAEIQVSRENYKALIESLATSKGFVEGLRLPDPDLVRDNGVNELLRSDAVRVAFLDSKEINIPKKKAEADPLVKQVAKLEGARWQLEENEKVKTLAEKFYRAELAKVEAADAELAAELKDVYFYEDGELKNSYLSKFVYKATQYRTSDGVDLAAMRDAISKKFRNAKLEAEFKKFATEKLNEISEGKKLFKGFTKDGNRKYAAYTLDNVVKEMTQKLQGGEDYFYGPGSIRSAYASELKSIKEVQNRRGDIVSNADMLKVKQEAEGKTTDALDALAKFYKFDANGFGYGEDAGRAISEGPKGWSEAFRITPESKKIITDLVSYLKNLPTEYFENKMQRAVGIGEFKAAVVPHNVSPDTVALLKRHGVTDIRKYKAGDDTDRNAKIKKSKDLLFQGERGFFNTRTNTMGLLKDADLSTYLHETGHYWLESMHQFAQRAEASPGLKKDFDELLNWFNVEGDTPEARLENWNKRDTNAKREGHEKFAEGFERYLMEGKAPTAELQSLFSRFRSWLVSVYEGIRAPGEVFSPEVKAVFDRMFASDQAIVEAERQRAYFPADFQDANPELLAQYNELGRKATDDAVADMQARTLRDMKWLNNAQSKAMKALQREAKGLRTAIRDEVTKQVMAEPVNQAHEALKEVGLKINSTGIEMDMLAERYGFANGKTLTDAIRSENVKEKINGLVDQRMLERHGEFVDATSLQRAAEAVIANDARAKQMATGLKILTKSPIPVTKIQKAAREAAETTIAAKTIQDLRPSIYSAAETRANKELLKLAPKDPAAAAQAQRAALLNNRLFKASTDAVNDVRGGLTYLKKFNKDTIRAKIDVDIRDQIDDLLARFDLRANPNTDPTRQQMNLEKWIESQMAAGMQPTVTEAMLDTRNRKPYRQMTVEEFRGLIDTIKSMEHVGRERVTLTVKGEKFALADYVNNELVPRMKERGDNFTTEELYTRPDERGISEWRQGLDRFGSWIRSFNAQLKGQEFKRNEYDMHELMGPFGQSLFEPVMQANYRKVDMLKGLSDDFRAKVKELGTDWQKSLIDMLDNKTLMDDLASKEAGQPVPYKLSRGKMLGLAVHVGNESNFDKLTKGYKWEPTEVWKFLDENMTAKDWNAVQTIWDLYEKHWPEQVAMYRRLGQTAPDKIEPRPFKTRFGEMRGGYATIKYDALRSRRGEKDAQGMAINPNDGLFGRDYFSRNSTTNGAMKARNDHYTDTIDLNFRTIERAMHETIHDLAYREALINANKVIEQHDFRKQFLKTYGREDYRALQDWIGRLANAENTDRNVGAFGRFLQYTRSGLVINAIALRASVVAKHGGSAGIKTMGYFVGGGEHFLASRFASMTHDYRNQIESAIEKFPEIRARLLQQDRDYRATASSLFESESLQSRAERFGHAAVAWADMVTAVPTAWAAYDRAITVGIPKNQGGTGKPMTEAQAVEYGSKIVREAHGSNIESARSNIMTSPSEAIKMFTTLYGFMNNSYGQIADSINKVRTPGLGNEVTLARTFMAIVVPGIWAGFLVHGVPDDTPEDWAIFIAKALFHETAGTVVGLRDVVPMLDGFSHAGVIGAESWMATLVKAGKNMVDIARGEDTNKPILNIANAMGVGLHIPGLGQIGKSAQYLSDVNDGKIPEPDNAGKYVWETLMGHKAPH